MIAHAPSHHPDLGADPAWSACRFLTCSVLPVRVACNLSCPFCFSRSSISALRHDPADWSALDPAGYYRFARDRGANRLVITGGGEPLLRPDAVVDLIARGAEVFGEIALFTNGSRLTPALARRLAGAGLSYLCYSRHAADDQANRALMGRDAPDLAAVVEAAGSASIPIRATCVMVRGGVEDRVAVRRYTSALRAFGIRQFTFKHTYVAYEGSVFRDSPQDRWAAEHRVDFDPFEGEGTPSAALPWGPVIRDWEGLQVCYYHEPTPDWERTNRLARSSNLLSDGSVFASLEDLSSLLYRLTPC